MGGRWLQLLLRQNRNRSRQPLARLPLLILLTATALALVTLYTFYYTAASSGVRRLGPEETMLASLRWGQWNITDTASGSGSRPPKILLWSTHFGISPDQHYGIRAALEKCPVQCLLTENKLERSEAHV